MNSRFFLLLLFLLPLSGWSQATLDSAWFGHWRGELHIFSPVKEIMTLDMELTIEPADTADHYQWTLVYLPRDSSMPVDSRPYVLIPQEAPGHFVIDEQNSIYLDVHQYDNRLLSHFRVNDSQLMITYALMGETLRFEVLPATRKGSRSSGDDLEDLEVESFRINGYQWAELKRVE